MRKKIILIADDTTAIQTIKEYLSYTKFAFDILHATSGYLALEISHSVRPHLIILNSELPDMSGFDIIKRLKNDRILMRTVIESRRFGLVIKINKCFMVC